MNDQKRATQSSNILIVDDNPDNLQVLGSFLQKEDFSVEFALDGNSALDWISKYEFDLILLDINMPGMDGFETCTLIKKDPVKSRIPIIFLTASNDTSSLMRAFEVGAVDYITKPFNHKELITRVKTQINIKNALNEIKNKNRLIIDSIEYANMIQTAMINNHVDGLDYFKEHFILFLPKDIVSGDFYWVFKVDKILLLGVFDCTGHGVPGAFMSMLGITFLNEIVISEKVYNPDKILNRLRHKIIETLGQHGDSKSVTDGMDGSLIMLDTTSQKLYYSGAFNSLYFVRKKELIELKADRMPLSYYEKMHDFSIQDIDILPGDIIYLFTDGYIDQLGGKEMKRMKSKPFREILLDHHHYPFESQKKILTEKYLSWKGDSEQMDDITILGLRF